MDPMNDELIRVPLNPSSFLAVKGLLTSRINAISYSRFTIWVSNKFFFWNGTFVYPDFSGYI